MAGVCWTLSQLPVWCRRQRIAHVLFANKWIRYAALAVSVLLFVWVYDYSRPLWRWHVALHFGGLPHAIDWQHSTDVRVCLNAAHAPALELSSRANASSVAVGGTDSELPYCSALNPRIACMLQSYKRNIQIPALAEQRDARCHRHLPPAADEPAQATAGDGSGVCRQKWVLFQIVDEFGMNGGFADRQKGILMALSLALVLDRAFGMSYQLPTPLHSVLPPAVLPWRDDHIIPRGLRRETITIDHSTGTSYVLYNWLTNPKSVKAFADALLHPIRSGGVSYVDPLTVDCIVLRININQFDEFATANPFFRSKWTALGFVTAQQQTGGKHAPLPIALGAGAYACLNQYMFRLAPRVTDLLTKSGLVSSGRFAPSSAVNAPLLVCLQFRMGADPTKPAEAGAAAFRDSRLFNSLDSLRRVWAVLRDFIAYNKYVFYIATDSDAAVTAARNEWGAVNVRTIDGPIVHLDRLEPAMSADTSQLLAGFTKVVADSYVLGECDFAVISDSGMGRLGVWRTRLPPARVRVLQNGFVSDDPALILRSDAHG